MSSNRDQKDEFGSAFPSNSEDVGKEAPGEFTKAFLADAGAKPPNQSLEPEKSAPAHDFKVQHDATAGDFTRMFDGLKAAKPSNPVDEGVNSLDSAPTLSFQVPPATTSPRGEEKPIVASEPGEFTRAFSDSGKPVQWHRDGDQGPGSPLVGGELSPFRDFAPKPVPSLEPTPTPAEDPFRSRPSTDDFTSVFQRALGSQAPRPATPSGYPPPFNPAGTMSEPAEKPIFSPVEQRPQATKSPNWGPLPQEPSSGPGEFTTFMKRLEPSGNTLPEAPRAPIPPAGKSPNEGATDIFHMAQETPGPMPPADLGPSKFTQFMKLSEIRSAEEKFSEAEAAGAAPPSGGLPNMAWPPAPTFPPAPVPPVPAMPAPNFQPAPVPPVPQMPNASFPPQPIPQMPAPSIPQMAFPPAVPAVIPQAPARPAPPQPPTASPNSKLATYLPLILILNGLFLVAILLIVLFALKK